MKPETTHASGEPSGESLQSLAEARILLLSDDGRFKNAEEMFKYLGM